MYLPLSQAAQKVYDYNSLFKDNNLSCEEYKVKFELLAREMGSEERLMFHLESVYPMISFKSGISTIDL